MSVSSPEEHSHCRKKRVGKACDSCRIKKTKCDGKKPCSRCIADNKLCAFTEKKKLKEKCYPTGYIDLLETRIDLLTKSLMKVVALAEPHLPILQRIIEKARLEHRAENPSGDDALSCPSEIPINELVSYLISNIDRIENEQASGVSPCAEVYRNTSYRPEPVEEMDQLAEVKGEEKTEGKIEGGKIFKTLHFPAQTRVASPALSQRPSGVSDNCVTHDSVSENNLFTRYSSPTLSRSNSPNTVQLNPANSLIPDPYSFFRNNSNSHFILESADGQQSRMNYRGTSSSPPSEQTAQNASSAYDSVDEMSLRQSGQLIQQGQASSSESPSYISSASSNTIKLETQTLGIHSHQRPEAGRSQSTKSHISAYSAKGRNGNVFKPRTTMSHSSSLVSSHASIAAGMIQKLPNKAFSGFPEVTSAYTDQILRPFEYQSEKYYNEISSKAAETISSYMDGDDLARSNLFLSSFNYR